MDGKTGEQQGNSLAAREMYWEECSIEQKIDRLRSAVVSLYQRGVTVSKSVDDLMSHEHANDGTLLKPILDGRYEPMGYEHNPIPYNIRTERERGR